MLPLRRPGSVQLRSPSPGTAASRSAGCGRGPTAIAGAQVPPGRRDGRADSAIGALQRAQKDAPQRRRTRPERERISAHRERTQGGGGRRGSTTPVMSQFPRARRSPGRRWRTARCGAPTPYQQEYRRPPAGLGGSSSGNPVSVTPGETALTRRRADSSASVARCFVCRGHYGQRGRPRRAD